MIIHNAYGLWPVHRRPWRAITGAERLGCTVVPVSGGMTERQVQLINDFKPDIHHGDAKLYAGNPGRIQKGRAWNLASRPLKFGILRRRALDQRDARPRSRRRSIWTPTDIYGLSESDRPPAVAQEWRRDQRTACMSWEDHFYPEVIDPRDRYGCCPTVKRASLFSTSLTKEAFPIIRYRTRDLTRFAAGARARPGMRAQWRRFTGRFR